jgi:hypothetical protein
MLPRDPNRDPDDARRDEAVVPLVDDVESPTWIDIDRRES